MFCYNNNSNNNSPFFAPQPSVSPFGFSRSASTSSFGSSSFGSHSPLVSATTPLPPTSGFFPCANHNPFPFGNGGYGSNNNDDTVMKHETFGAMEFEIVDGDTIMACVEDDTNNNSYYCIDDDGDAIMSDMDWE